MQDYGAIILPWLNIFREWIMKLAEFLSKIINLEPSQINNVYLVLMILISLFIAQKILTIFYSSLEGRTAHWLIASGVLLWFLKFWSA